MQEQNEARGFTVRQIEGELKRLRRKQNSRRIFRQTVFSLLVVAAVAVLAAMLFFPIFRVTGSSMEPTLDPKEIVVCLKSSRFQSGDLVAFYYNNKVLLKRVIGTAGDTIEIDDSGNVFVNGSQLDEPYITKKSLGQCDIDFPYHISPDRTGGVHLRDGGQPGNLGGQPHHSGWLHCGRVCDRKGIFAGLAPGAAGYPGLKGGDRNAQAIAAGHRDPAYTPESGTLLCRIPDALCAGDLFCLLRTDDAGGKYDRGRPQIRQSIHH